MTHYRCKEQPKINFKQSGKIVVNLVIAAVFVLLCAFYLFQTNTLVAKNFQLRAYQKSLQESQKKNQQAEIALLQIRSLDNLQAAAKNLNLVTIDKAQYLKIAPGYFALSQ